MRLKIGWEHWHVECEVDGVDDLVNGISLAWAAHAEEFGIGHNNSRHMRLATWSGREWWSVPPDHYAAQRFGDVTVVWPVGKNDCLVIWERLQQSFQYGQKFNEIVGFVSSDTPGERRARFRVVKNDLR